MEINRLKFFRTVVEAGSMRRAAELLHITPGALSKSMSYLEGELERALFVPSGRGIAVTDEGKRLYSLSTHAISAYEAMLAELDRGTPRKPPLRIASSEVFTTYCLGAMMAGGLAGLPLIVHTLSAGQIEDALVKNEIDIGFTYVPFPHPELDFIEATDFAFGFYGLRRRFGQAAFMEIPFAVPIGYVSGSPTDLIGFDGWPIDKYERLVFYWFGLLESGLETARRGLAGVFIPHFIAAHHNRYVKRAFRLETLPLPADMPEVRQRVFVVRRKADAGSGHLPRLASELRAVCA